VNMQGLSYVYWTLMSCNVRRFEPTFQGIMLHQSSVFKELGASWSEDLGKGVLRLCTRVATNITNHGHGKGRGAGPISFHPADGPSTYLISVGYTSSPSFVVW